MPIGSEPMRARGIDVDAEVAAAVRAASRIMRAPIDQPERGSSAATPSSTFSATDRSGTMLSSWCTMPMPAARASRAERNRIRLAVEPHHAVVFGVHAGDDLHHRAFAGAVLADQAVDLARAQGEVHVGQRRHAAEGLGDAAQLQRGGDGGSRRRSTFRSGSGLPSTSCRGRWPW